MPIEVNVHESADDPAPVTLVGERLHEVLFVVRLTRPVKPFTAAIVTVDEPAAFTSTLILVGLADIEKSWTTNVTVTE